ncbi:hypothetical protein HY572_00950 [Candidatus Micrarchaeota archaeon]|nr:hypothetical protein [Candidatus Micrarchaeota archaeon]
MVLPLIAVAALPALPTVLALGAIAVTAFVVGEEIVKPITQPAPAVQATSSGFSISPLILLGGLAIAAFLLLRK